MLLRCLISALLILMSGLLGAEQKTSGYQQETLVLGVYAYRDKQLLQQRFQPLVEYLSEQLTDQQVVLEVLSDQEIWSALQRHELDFVLTNPANYIALREHDSLSGALATLVRKEGGVTVNALGGVILQPASQPPLTELRDLEGKTLAISGSRYLGGYLAPLWELVTAQVALDKIHWLEVGLPHDRVIEALLEGKADIGFVRTGVLEDLMARELLAEEALRVLHAQDLPGFPYQVSTRLYPEWPLIALPQVEPQVARQVAAALLSLASDHPAAKAASIAGFNVPADYSLIERVMRDLRMEPFDQVPEVSWVDIWHRYSVQILAVAGFMLLILVLLFLLMVLNRRLNLSRQHLEKIAHYDLLTGLPNRHLLTQRLHKALQIAEQSHQQLAIAYLDLDNFKQLNDLYGHRFGDELLQSLAVRLQTQIDHDETLARVSGDEFVLLLVAEQEKNLDCRLEALLDLLREPWVLSRVKVALSASVGITLFPADQGDPDTLLRHADEAMFQAKALGKNRLLYFDASQKQEQQERQQRLQRLEEALLKQELCLYYQPKVDLRTQAVIGVEALIRWQHPEQGLLAPGAFLPDVEGSELEVPLGLWVLEQALTQLQHWHELGLPLAVSVNISANHLLSPGFVKDLKELLQRFSRLPAASLEIEVLETAALSSLDEGQRLLEECHQLGVQISLDDFGTGYSSLSYFRKLPVDILKIDQSFVRDMLDDQEDRSIVESVVRLAAAFNRQVIAEGVETPQHAEALLELGCFLVQGYGIAKPMPAAVLPQWLEEWVKNADIALAN